MSKLNKIITNKPVVLTNEEVRNLSETLSAVRTAGGGEGGQTYIAGDEYISVNNTQYTISLSNKTTAMLNSIPSAVSALPDASDYAKKTYVDNSFQTKADMSAYLTTANAASTYQTIDGMNDYVGQQEYNDFKNTTNSNFNNKQNKLNFGYDENNAISSIDGHKLAGAGGVTGDYYSASNPSGFINSAQAETQILSKNYITSGVSELDNFYSKSQTSGAEEIANAIKDFVDTDLLETTSGALKTWVSTNYYDKTETSSKTELQTKFNSLLDYDVVTGNSAVLITTADANNTRTFTISLTATPTAADTVLNGQNGVDATLNGNVWYVGLSQSAYNAVNDVQNKLDTTTFNTFTGTTLPSEYPKKTDIPDSVSDLTDSANYYKKSETSGATELSTEFAKYIQTISTGVGLSGDGKTTALGIDTTASINFTNASAKSAVSAEYANIAKGAHTDYTLGSTLDTMSNITATIDASLMSMTGYNGIERQIDETTYYATAFGLTNSAYAAVRYVTANSGNWDNVSSKLNTSDFNIYTATTAPSTYQPKGDYLSANALTNYYTKDETSGAAQISAALAALPGGGITEVTHDTTLTGKGNSTQNLGVAWSALSGNTINSAKSAGSAEGLTNGIAYSGFDDISAAFGNLSSYLPTSGGTVSGQLVISGGSNFDQQFLKITRENVNGHARLGLGQYGALALKADDSNSHTTQINVSPNTTNDQLVQVQHNGNSVGYLIPAVTANTTAGLTNDGILHIIVES